VHSCCYSIGLYTQTQSTQLILVVMTTAGHVTQVGNSSVGKLISVKRQFNWASYNRTLMRQTSDY